MDAAQKEDNTSLQAPKTCASSTFQEIWEDEEEIYHSYFQKPRKTPFVLIARSAIAIQEKLQILLNEEQRRLSNIMLEKVNK